MWVAVAMYALLVPSAALFLLIRSRRGERETVMFKALCTAIILAAGVIWLIGSPHTARAYAALIVVGIALGLAGDVAICYSFIAGMIFFGLGHICYIAAILQIPLNPLACTVLFAAAALVFALYRRLRLDLGTLLVPVVIYGVIIISMLSLAVSAAFTSSRPGSVLACAAVSFTISDAMLAANKFKFKSERLGHVSLIFYYLGQSLFALSVFYAG